MGRTLSGLLLILDGVGDRPSAPLNGKTPLEAARTPHLDALIARGMGGMMDPLIPGAPVSTDVGVGALMGVPAPHGFLARGPVEALGAGLSLSPEDVAFRCNLATVTRVGERFQLLDRRAGRIESRDSEELARFLDRNLGEFEGVTAQVAPATGHRLVLALKGMSLSASLTDPDPGAGWEERGVLLCQPRPEGGAAAERTAKVVNHFVARSHELLDEHPLNRERRSAGKPPGNLLMPRAGGRLRGITSIPASMGVRSALVAGEKTVVGLARLLGADVIPGPGFTGEVETDLAGKVEAASRALEGYDLVFLHIKGLDVLSHDRKPDGKRALLEVIDDALAPLLDREDIVITVTGDHSTLCLTGRHSGDPVPSILYSPLGRVDGVTAYGEGPCMTGGLGRLSANELLWSMLDQMNFTKNYRPGHFESLEMTRGL